MPSHPDLSAEDVKSWYNQHYAAKGLQTMRPAAAYPVFLDLLGARAGNRLLDVSCGAGSLLAAAGARDLDAVGVDLSDEAVRLAKRVARLETRVKAEDSRNLAPLLGPGHCAAAAD